VRRRRRLHRRSGARRRIRRRGVLWDGRHRALFGRRARRADRAAGDWYYLDNAYFDARAGAISGSRATPAGAARAPDRERLEALGVEVKPWRRAAACPGRRAVGLLHARARGWPGGLGGWRDTSCAARGAYGPADPGPAWQARQGKASSSLAEDLADCWAVVTHSSAAANEALLAGVPVFLTGETPRSSSA
jgi:hypothetical protein